MVMAKLLAGLASALAVLALVAGFLRITPFDIFFLDGYFVVTSSVFFFFVALICGILALLYFAISRWSLRLANQLVGLVSFAIIVISLGALVATVFFVRNDLPPHYRQFYALFGALYGLLLGLILHAANLAWAFVWILLGKVQSHFSSR